MESYISPILFQWRNKLIYDLDGAKMFSKSSLCKGYKYAQKVQMRNKENTVLWLSVVVSRQGARWTDACAHLFSVQVVLKKITSIESLYKVHENTLMREVRWDWSDFFMLRKNTQTLKLALLTSGERHSWNHNLEGNGLSTAEGCSRILFWWLNMSFKLDGSTVEQKTILVFFCNIHILGSRFNMTSWISV